MYTLKKDKTILERLGTITLLGMFQAALKIGTCTGFFYLISLFESLEECILLAVSLFATDNFHTLNIIQEGFLSRQSSQGAIHTIAERRKNRRNLIFLQAESIGMNVLMVILAYTFHPFATHNLLKTHSFLFRLFANVFFSGMIGMSWAFLASYSLKESVKGLSLGSISARLRENINHQSDESSTLTIDNFDILMMVLPPVVSYLMAETFSISGFLALMWCAFLQSMYAQSNLESDRSTLLLNVLKALSYTFRSICDILIGLSLPLYWAVITKEIGLGITVVTLVIIFLVSFSASYVVVKRMRGAKLVKSDLEATVLIF